MRLSLSAIGIVSTMPNMPPSVSSLALIILCTIGTIAHAGGTARPPVAPQPAGPYEAIDRHALAAPKDTEESLDKLAAYLAQPAKTERDKARAIFRWMSERIRFNADAHFTGHPGELQPDAVLRDREATAFGYANLYEALARRAGLEVVTLHGHAKMKHHTEEGRLTKVKHAWNAVRVDGYWFFVDTTWGAGYIKGQRWHRMCRDQYFLAAPHQMILTHIPLDPRWQLLSVPITPAQFDAAPLTNAKFLHMGVRSDLQAQRIKTPEYRRSVGSATTQFFLQTGKVKVIMAPTPGASLTCRGEHFFVIEAADVAQMALWNNGSWFLLHKNGTRFEGGIRPEPGELRLCLQRPLDSEFQAVLTYKVVEK